jgi:catechol 2,3-dioxygenase-like lactoylglutathione lyase family enzyme
MKYICSLIAVEDIRRSRQLYEDILGQKVISDFGEYNVTFEGGLALYQRNLYQSLIGSEKVILNQPNNFELYFEEDNLPEFENAIARNGFEFVHGIREEPWKQQVFRFYDYDRNIVVIAESMEKVCYRLSKENKTIEEISHMTGEPAEQVLQQIKDYKESVR